MRIVKMVFRYNPKSILTKSISWYTSEWKERLNGEWKNTANHVEIVFDNVMYSADGTTGSWRGKRYNINENWRVYTIPVSDAEYKEMEDTAMVFVGTEYDWMNIFLSDIWHLNLGHPDRLTCDEGCARILHKSSVGKDLVYINNLNPNELEKYIINKGFCDDRRNYERFSYKA